MATPAGKGFQVDISHVEEATFHFSAAIERLKDNKRKEHLMQLFDSEVGTAFFMAPSSSRAEYHNCYAGGLAEHSLEVAKYMNELAVCLCPGKYDEDQLTFLALIHDLGKAGDGDEEYYIFNENDWSRENRGIMYELNDKCQRMTISDRTLYLLQKYNVKLTADEILAIRLVEMDPNEMPLTYSYNEPVLALLLRFANRWAIERANQK